MSDTLPLPRVHTRPDDEKVAWVRSIPFILLHVAVVLVVVTRFSWSMVALAAATYFVRMFFITAGYHRYFAHRTFKTSRLVQFLFAFGAQTSIQKGVLWWAGHHRHHHRYSDQVEDIHSPVLKGFWWSHVGWILCMKFDATPFGSIKDFARYPELRFLNRFHWLPAVLTGAVLYLGWGFDAFVWGGLVSTVLLWHGTFTINSLSHVFGSRRYLTTDTSKNNFVLSLITLGEGWHNNHHYHQNTVNQGWFFWELDVTYLVLRVLAAFRIVWDLRVCPDAVRFAYRHYTPEQQAQVQVKAKYFRPRTEPTPAPEPAVGLRPPITSGARAQ